MHGPPIDVLPLFAPERAALLALLDGLTAGDWHAPTVCPGWVVKDVAAHLLADDVGRLSRGRDGFANPAFASGLDVATWAGLVAAIDRQNDEWVRAARRLSPPLLVDLLRFTGEQTEAYFRSLDPLRIGGPVDWAGPGPAPVWLDLAREYAERWVHQQQIRDAVGRPGGSEPGLFAPVLATFARALPHALRDVPAPVSARVRLVVTGDAGGVWTAVHRDDRWELDADHQAPASATVTVDQDLAWRLFTKGMSLEGANARVGVEGDAALAGAVLRMVTILA